MQGPFCRPDNLAMKEAKRDEDHYTNLLLRLPIELKHELQKVAMANRRAVTAEINLRLEESLKQSAAAVGYPTLGRATVVHTEEGRPVELTDHQRSMLVVFDRLPPEKQLALLSLFK